MFSALAGAGIAGLAAGEMQRAAITITVQDTPRQTFRGFGVSVVPMPDYAKLTEQQKAELGKVVWRDMNMKIMRLWLDLTQYAPKPDARDLGPFREAYIRSGRIKAALDNGCEEIMITPCSEFPDWLRGPEAATGADGKKPVRPLVAPGKEKEYARALADVVRELRDKDNIAIGAISLCNEPTADLGFAWLTETAKALRADLDGYGLKDVKIVCPETASMDWVWDQCMAAFQKDPAAMNALGVTASHSYNMAGNGNVENFVLKTGKEFWMTEASGNGPATVPDAEYGASAACRFLCDLNHAASCWIWFIGDERNDPRDDKTRLIRWWPNPEFRYECLTPYHYLLHASRAFPPGTVVRRCVSSKDKDMSWTYGIKPWLIAGAGVRKDGTWCIALCNNTAARYAANAPDRPKGFELEQGLHEARTMDVTIELPKEALSPDATFRITRTDGVAIMKDGGTVTASDGKLVITISPLELVSLESAK